ncbi:MAG TPA: class I SAM-dependent methyltransferase [Solirubrobacterales bacterium]|nr:class I SAM-dependent methyltransferase [Solirubrobacterales bacterium]
MSAAAPADWYRTSFAENHAALYRAEDGPGQVALAMEILRPAGGERVLDLACGTGGRLLELCRRGFDAVGSDVRQGLLEAALGESEIAGLEPWFIEGDPRELGAVEDFDIVLSLGAGAFGHCGSDEEDLRAFEAVAAALRPGGRLLAQLPNRLNVEAALPDRTWIESDGARDTIEQRWDGNAGRIQGTRASVLLDDPDLEDTAPSPFQRRVYSLEELETMLERAGLTLAGIYNEAGANRPPLVEQWEVYVVARK